VVQSLLYLMRQFRSPGCPPLHHGFDIVVFDLPRAIRNDVLGLGPSKCASNERRPPLDIAAHSCG